MEEQKSMGLTSKDIYAIVGENMMATIYSFCASSLVWIKSSAFLGEDFAKNYLSTFLCIPNDFCRTHLTSEVCLSGPNSSNRF